ncbi:MAG: PD-(D/E)XK nuclease family protein [Pseudomonadota bacterium]|nr:PD-(D/E)XK nuclease family protein [Pseudomonadota bacterium]
MIRRTVIVEEKLAAREARLAAARLRAHGLQAMSAEQAAARLAGGLLRPIDQDSLRLAIQKVIPSLDLGDLQPIRDLPGTAAAAAATLRKAWLAGLDLVQDSGRLRRLAELAVLEREALDALPKGMLRPCNLVLLALDRLQHAPALLGDVEVRGACNLDPCWRPLILALAERVRVTWHAGPREVPAWLDGTSVGVVRTAPETPAVECVSAGTERHEVTEALRWARRLVADGIARPHEIAIAAVDTRAYDEFMLALRREANLNVAFADGVPAPTMREGQAAAALADVLAHGPDQTRIRRLATLAGAGGSFSRLPLGWQRVMPPDAALADPADWQRLLGRLRPEDWPEGRDAAAELQGILELLLRGRHAAAEAGEAIFEGGALAIWRNALRRGGAAGIERALSEARVQDEHDPCASIAWMKASALAAAPRPFARLLGLSSASWPRPAGEDPLIPDHVVPAERLEPTSTTTKDRLDFSTILATSARAVVLSRPRRDAQGRLLRASPLLRGVGPETHLRRDRRPEHAVTETDRLAGRPSEFAETPAARSGARCWSNRLRDEITPHDGLVRPDHPAILAALSRVQSASSLSLLVRNPLGFAWRYGLGLKEPDLTVAPIVLPPPDFGTLVHEVLERAVVALEASGGLARATSAQAESAVAAACDEAAAAWSERQGTPPGIVWQRTLLDVRTLAFAALALRAEPLPGQTSHAEVPFGGQPSRGDRPAPWDNAREVAVPGTPFRIGGYIDRLDLTGDRSAARVVDYKTGRVKPERIVLDGGRELQRCLYAYAVSSLLGSHVEVEAELAYLRGPELRRLENGSVVLGELALALAATHDAIEGGLAVPGVDAGSERDDLRFALPANALGAYCPRKAAAAAAALGPAATAIWEAA